MKLIIESTSITTRIDNVPVRLWEGVTPQGVRCKVFVHRVVVDESARGEFRDLIEMLPPPEFMELGEILK